jgi:hypothetical protein
MRAKRLATLLLGAWLGAGLLMSWVAASNFESADSVVKSSAGRMQREVKEIGAERLRMILRHHSSEQNRHYFNQWEWIQLLLGVALAVLLLFETNANRIIMGISILMLALTAIQHFTITPQIIEIGRSIDFSSNEDMVPERQVFWNYHRAYSVLEVLKLGAGFVLSLRLLYGSSRTLKRKRRKQVNAVDNADDGHVDG